MIQHCEQDKTYVSNMIQFEQVPCSFYVSRVDVRIGLMVSRHASDTLSHGTVPGDMGLNAAHFVDLIITCPSHYFWNVENGKVLKE